MFGIEVPPLVILAIGIATVIGMIIVLRLNAFIALITAAMLVSLLAPGETAEKISRVATAFGGAAGSIGIVIALAAVIGKCMMDSGAADKVVRSFLRLLGEKQAPLALMGSGFVLAVPVFFDTVFYLLIPLARSLWKTTRKNYLLYVLAISAGGAITHTLVPPTPGPLLMASNLKFDVGIMIMVGGFVALPAAFAGIAFSALLNRWMDIPMRSVGTEKEPDPLSDDELPSLWISLLPVVLPVLLISANTIVGTMMKQDGAAVFWSDLFPYTSLIGNANLALLLSTAIALATLKVQRNLSFADLGKAVEIALMSGGVIILITAAGGAFGAMLKVAQIGDAIEAMFEGKASVGTALLWLGFGVAALLKVAQGSSTVAMITGSAMLAAIIGDDVSTLGYHPVYLATAIGGGSLIGSWMNDSGFWIFSKMSGLTEVEGLKTWTPMLVVLGLVSMGMTLILVNVMPLTSWITVPPS